MAAAEDPRTAAEKLIERARIDDSGSGRALSERARHRARSIEAYLRGDALPRYMERAREIDHAVRRHERELARAYREHGHGAAWRALAERWDFSEVNALIAEHNEWYPVERDLPMNPRTKDYVLVNGKPYRREPLGPGWILARYPA